MENLEKTLTKEQKEKIKQLTNQLFYSATIIALLHFLWIGFGALGMFLLNTLYFHNEQAFFLGCFGSSFIIFLGMQTAIFENFEQYKEKVKRIVDK